MATAPPAPALPTPPPPSDVYAIFCGGNEQATAQKIVNGLTAAMALKVKHVHVLFQTAGGYIADVCSSTTSSALYPLN